MGTKRRSMFRAKFKSKRAGRWEQGRKVLGIPTEAELEAQRLEEARLKASAAAKLKAEQEAKLKAEQEAKLKAEQEAKLKAEQEAKAKAEQARLKLEQEAKLKAGQEAAALKTKKKAPSRSRRSPTRSTKKEE